MAVIDPEVLGVRIVASMGEAVLAPIHYGDPIAEAARKISEDIALLMARVAERVNDTERTATDMRRARDRRQTLYASRCAIESVKTLASIGVDKS